MYLRMYLSMIDSLKAEGSILSKSALLHLSKKKGGGGWYAGTWTRRHGQKVGHIAPFTPIRGIQHGKPLWQHPRLCQVAKQTAWLTVTELEGYEGMDIEFPRIMWILKMRPKDPNDQDYSTQWQINNNPEMISKVLKYLRSIVSIP